MKRYMKVTTEHEIMGYDIYIRQREGSDIRDKFQADTLEAAISLAFKICFERFKTPPILSDGALDTPTYIQIGWEGIQNGQLVYGHIEAYCKE